MMGAPLEPAPSSHPRARRLALSALVLLAAALLIGLHFHVRRPEGRGFSLAHLSSFDGYVYLAMAESPAHFTVAPWGYRVLVPWMAHVADPVRPLRSFRWITLGALAVAGALLFFFLRRRGFGPVACSLGLGAFCLSTPVGQALSNPFVVDGVGVALALAFFVGIETGAALAPLLLVLALGWLTKDLFLAFVPLIFIPLRRRLSPGWAVAVTAGVALLGLALQAALRAYWTPHIHPPHPALGLYLTDMLRFELGSVTGRQAALASFLAGLVPLAVLGALRPLAGSFLRRYGYLALITFALPYVAWMNVPDTRPFGFFGDVPRLHIYALPLLIPLALIAVGRLVPGLAPRAPFTEPASVSRSRLASALAACALVVTLAAPFLAADSYRRVPLHARREGLQILLACRHSLTTAERLRRGETVELPVGRQDTLPRRDPRRWRWFLYGPWSDGVYAGEDDLRIAGAPVSILVPCFEPVTLDVTLRLVASSAGSLDLRVNDQPLGPVSVDPTHPTQTVRLPRAVLWRGDNVLTFSAAGAGASDVVIEALALRPQRSEPDTSTPGTPAP